MQGRAGESGRLPKTSSPGLMINFDNKVFLKLYKIYCLLIYNVYNHLETLEMFFMVYTWYIPGIYFYHSQTWYIPGIF